MARKVSSTKRMRDHDDYEDGDARGRFGADDDDAGFQDDGDDGDEVFPDDDDPVDLDSGEDDGEEEEAPVKKPKKAAKRKTSRSKAVRDVRQRAYWGVFDSSMKQVALFEYAKKKDAEKEAKQRSSERGLMFFVQIVRKDIE